MASAWSSGRLAISQETTLSGRTRPVAHGEHRRIVDGDRVQGRGLVFHHLPRRASALAPLQVAAAKKKKNADFLDFLEGGPKLRKWYGASDEEEERLSSRPGDGQEDDDEDDSEVSRNSVLVMDADSATGQMTVLELILRRKRVHIIVSNVANAVRSFGPYVKAFSQSEQAKALKQARIVIIPNRLTQKSFEDIATVLQSQQQGEEGSPEVRIIYLIATNNKDASSLLQLLSRDVGVEEETANYKTILERLGISYQILSVPAKVADIRQEDGEEPETTLKPAAATASGADSQASSASSSLVVSRQVLARYLVDLVETETLGEFVC